MNITDEMAERLPMALFPSAAGQGAIAIVAKEGNTEVINVLKSVEDVATRAEIVAERSLVLKLQGGCRVPIGAVAKAEGDNLSLYGSIFSLNDRRKISASAKGVLADAAELGAKVGEDLITQGAENFEKEWREKYGVW